MNTPIETIPYLINAILAICITVGAFFAVRNGRQKQLNEFQETTNTALTQRIAALEGKTVDLEKENAIQRHLIDTLISAFRQEGKIVTIDGDMITISDKDGIRVHRKRTTITQHSASVTKKEEV